MDEKQKIGQRLKKIRKEKGLTQTQMVSYFSIGRSNYSKMESGQITPGSSILAVLHSRFNVSLDWLITGEGPMFRKDNGYLDLENYSQDVKALLEDIGKDRAMKHALLSYYYTYKASH